MEGKRFRKIGLGGTFDILHKGHEEVLRLAFKLADRVALALSTDQLALEIKGRKVAPLEERKRRVEEFLRREGLLERAELVIIDSRYGTSVEDPEMDALLLSTDNEKFAEAINRERAKRGLKPLEIVVFRKVLAEDGKPISASRIRRGEIDRQGKLKAKP
ncbi:phosphopantetheine adenylyltransferase [Candidatus Bathyarchaeota archaeon]|nr:MAG: phosphopantetheine adenylyltransferase [Candidatus Hecatellales archaeon]RLI35828.1 MAG: phosphopantetheine adenylyltransferase [Candidatus Bathyarchaeota archaeon]